MNALEEIIEMSSDEKLKIYLSGEEDRHEYRVGFLVHTDKTFSTS